MTLEFPMANLARFDRAISANEGANSTPMIFENPSCDAITSARPLPQPRSRNVNRLASMPRNCIALFRSSSNVGWYCTPYFAFREAIFSRQIGIRPAVSTPKRASNELSSLPILNPDFPDWHDECFPLNRLRYYP